jgi:hypothetical protein
MNPTKTVALALLLLVAALSVGCGDALTSPTGPTSPTGSNCTLAGCAEDGGDQSPVEILDGNVGGA